MVSKKKVMNFTKIILGVCALITATSLLAFFITMPNKNYIRINSDRGFIRYNCPGDGTKENPYIIKNYNLVNPKKEFTGRIGIWIDGTTKFFVITNCTLSYYYFGILVVNVKPGTATIMNNTILVGGFMDAGSADAIGIGSSNATWIYNNSILGSYRSGIATFSSEDCIIEQNYCANSRYGIYISDANNITIMNNICDNNSFGIICFRNDESTFKQNWLLSNSVGIRSFDSKQNMIINNTFKNGCTGIGLINNQQIIIKLNSFYNSSGYAIRINIDSSNSTIYHNNFFHNNLEGSSQCYNEDYDSIWYNIDISEGNYWSDLGLNSTYEIDGSAGAVDLYPLSNPVT